MKMTVQDLIDRLHRVPVEHRNKMFVSVCVTEDFTTFHDISAYPVPDSYEVEWADKKFMLYVNF